MKKYSKESTQKRNTLFKIMEFFWVDDDFFPVGVFEKCKSLINQLEEQLFLNQAVLGC